MNFFILGYVMYHTWPTSVTMTSEVPSLLAVSLTPLSVEVEGESVPSVPGRESHYVITVKSPVPIECLIVAVLGGRGGQPSLVGLHNSLNTGITQLAQHGSLPLAYTLLMRLSG